MLDGGDGWPTAVPARAAAARASRGRAADRCRDAGQALRAGRWSCASCGRRAARRPRPEADPNQRAIVAHLRDGAFDLLLTADAESDVTAGAGPASGGRAEGRPPRQRRPGPARPARRLRPRVAAIAVGARQHLRAPGAFDAARAARAVPHVCRTDRDGTVRLRVRTRALERGGVPVGR